VHSRFDVGREVVRQFALSNRRRDRLDGIQNGAELDVHVPRGVQDDVTRPRIAVVRLSNQAALRNNTPSTRFSTERMPANVSVKALVSADRVMPPYPRRRIVGRELTRPA
jgi:hypothetical protein